MIVVAATVLNALWQDALLVVCVWLLLRAMPSINAATRYAVWSATLVAAIVVPIVTTLAFFAPAHVSPATTPTHSQAPIAHRFAPAQAAPAAESPKRANTLPQAAVPAASTTSATERAFASLPQRVRVTLPMPVAIGVFVAWVLLAAYALAGLLVGLWRLERLKRDALPLPVEYRDSMPQWNEANKGRRPVRLCVSEDIDVPVAVGLFDAMILIPRPLLERLSPNEVEQISLHELAHLRRADDWSNCMQRLIVAALGWNPAALFVAQQLELEREVACDDWVLSSVGGVRPYALCLTKMAETAAWPHHPMPAPGVFTTRKQISLRIERLLGSGRNIATSLAIGPTAAAIAAVGALALLIAFVAPSVAAPTVTQANITKTSVAQTNVAEETIVQGQRPPAPPEPQPPAKAQASAKPIVVTKTVYVNVNRATQVLARTMAPLAREKARESTLSTKADADAMALSAASSAMATAAKASAQAGDLGESISKSVDSMVQSTIAKQVNHAIGHTALASDGKSCVGCDLHGVNWTGRDLSGANYTGVDFRGANLANVNLSGSVLNGTDFSSANLHNVSFRNAHLTGCDFSDANLTGADFTGAWMSGCEFKNARLQSAQLRSILNGCKGCDFSRADLSGADLSGVRINGDDFSRADLRNANFSGAVLVGSDFSHARLDGANFNGATLNGCDMSGVDLNHVDLSKAKLIGMDFSIRNSPP